MRFKIVVWFFVICLIIAIEQIVLHVALPNIDTATAIEQMNGQSMYDNGFTLRDAAKNSAALLLCGLWTLVVFSNDILNAGQWLVRACSNEEREKE